MSIGMRSVLLDLCHSTRCLFSSSAVNVFSCQRPVTKVGPNGEEESWILKTYFSTEEMFPTVLRRSEIVDIQTIEISPIESALNDVRDKTKELNILKVRYTNLSKTGQAVSTNALSMSLDSAVDAPGNGGVSLYREAFLSPVYLIENPERSDQVQRLREAIEEQVRTIDACLRLHKALCPAEMVPFHDTLERFFRKNFFEEIRRLSIDAISPIESSPISRHPAHMGSLTHLHERNRSQASNVTGVTARSKNFYIPPLQLGNSVVTPPPASPRSLRTQTVADGVSVTGHGAPLPHNGVGAVPYNKQTPLQRNLADLARNGLTGIGMGGSGPSLGYEPGMSSMTIGGDTSSPHGSFVNVGATLPPVATLAGSAASLMTSNIGNSIGSIKGRFSRLGSLNFGRHGRHGHGEGRTHG
jgi:dedicator of cytokinesis protein 3